MQLSDTLRATIRWLRERGEASRERESVGNGRRARLGKAVAELPSQRSPARAGSSRSTLFDSPMWKTDCSPRMLVLAVIGSLLPAFRFSLFLSTRRPSSSRERSEAKRQRVASRARSCNTTTGAPQTQAPIEGRGSSALDVPLALALELGGSTLRTQASTSTSSGRQNVCPMASHERNVTSVRLRRRAGCVCASAVEGRVELRCGGTEIGRAHV